MRKWAKEKEWDRENELYVVKAFVVRHIMKYKIIIIIVHAYMWHCNTSTLLIYIIIIPNNWMKLVILSIVWQLLLNVCSSFRNIDQSSIDKILQITMHATSIKNQISCFPNEFFMFHKVFEFICSTAYGH